ncbi:hypothetical protein KUR41_005213 [Escherichia coli]|nr:hypothetical protein [Escherichia coli]
MALPSSVWCYKTYPVPSMGQDITSVRFHRPGCRGGTPARRFAERLHELAEELCDSVQTH